MQSIDRPFRFTQGFYIAWAFLLCLTLPLLRWMDIGPWYSNIAFMLCIPFLATFAVYGPILFVGQIIHSGERGKIVARRFGGIVLTAILLFGGLLLSGYYTEGRARILAYFFAVASTAYLKLRPDRAGP